jgi:hypothetical protein
MFTPYVTVSCGNLVELRVFLAVQLGAPTFAGAILLNLDWIVLNLLRITLKSPPHTQFIPYLSSAQIHNESCRARFPLL